MKKILITLFIALTVFSAQRIQAEVSLSLFYDSLEDEGDWFEADDYGYCWQPSGVSADWSPYTDGYWTYTDAGWTWVSYESHGWATHHYGRWSQFRGRGWVWIPGYEWGPAWVSWRSNDDYVGWAPLPARATIQVGFSIGRNVDYDYDSGPSNYRFTSCNNFGSPSLRQVIVDRSENVTIINQTTNITNITYRDSVVYNGGPDYDRINRRSKRPIERLKLDRITQIDGTRDNRFARRENGRLSVVAPPVVPVEERIRPRAIKASLGKVETENGWSGVKDAKLAQRTRQKIREENKDRTEARVDRTGSVAKALRQEARQKQVASIAPQTALIRPGKNKGDKNREAKPIADRQLKGNDPAPQKPMDGRPDAALENPQTAEKPVPPENQANPGRKNQGNGANKENRNQEAARKAAKSNANNEEAVRQRQAARRQEANQKAAQEQQGDQAPQIAPQAEAANAQREQQANRQREKAKAARQNEAANAQREEQGNRQREEQGNRQREEQGNRQREEQGNRQREEQENRQKEKANASRQEEQAAMRQRANSARQEEQGALRQQAERRANQQQIQENRVRPQREEAQQQRRQQVEQQRQQAEPPQRQQQVRPAERQQPRQQAQKRESRDPQPTEEEIDQRKKRRNSDDR